MDLDFIPPSCSKDIEETRNNGRRKMYKELNVTIFSTLEAGHILRTVAPSLIISISFGTFVMFSVKFISNNTENLRKVCTIVH